MREIIKGVPSPSVNFDRVSDQSRARPMFSEFSLNTAADKQRLGITGNEFLVDNAYPLLTYGATQATLYIDGTPITISPGFYMRVPFDDPAISWNAQSGKRLRIVYGVDLGLFPGNPSVFTTPANLSDLLTPRVAGATGAGFDYSGHQAYVAGGIPAQYDVILTGGRNLVSASIHAHAVIGPFPTRAAAYAVDKRVTVPTLNDSANSLDVVAAELLDSSVTYEYDSTGTGLGWHVYVSEIWGVKDWRYYTGAPGFNKFRFIFPNTLDTINLSIDYRLAFI